MRPYENTCIDYILGAESLYVRVELQCFLYFEMSPWTSTDYEREVGLC